jgi:SAM-dependent methyltransferase
MSFDELKQRQSAAWGAAPFENVAAEIADVHDDLIDRLAPTPGEKFLDVACGTGGVAERAAARGAEVTGTDFASQLVETARRRAEERGLAIHYDVGDAEALPYEDASFDVVASCFGVMFAPNQERAAAELARVCKPGGRIGLACWSPEGKIAEFFALMATFQPPPPPGVPSPMNWGTEAGVRALLGDAFELELIPWSSDQTGKSGEEIWQLFSTSFGPTKVLLESLGPDRGEELHQALVSFWEASAEGDGIRQPRAYLVTLGTRLPV